MGDPSEEKGRTRGSLTRSLRILRASGGYRVHQWVRSYSYRLLLQTLSLLDNMESLDGHLLKLEKMGLFRKENWEELLSSQISKWI